MDEITQRVFQFDDFLLDAARRLLRKGDRDVPLRPKSFDVLCCLVENAGRIVPKDELINTVWRDVAATDESLVRCISDVRLALGDAEQKVVKTIPRCGYMFAASPSRTLGGAPLPPSLFDMESSNPRSGAAVPSAPLIARASSWKRGHWTIVFAVTVLFGAIVAASLLYIGPHGSQRIALPDQPSIAVLPFANLSGHPEQDYFGDGVAEEITTSLARFSDLFVITRDSAYQFKDKRVDTKQAGRELGVRYLIQGSVRRDGERLRVNTQLIDAVGGREIWAEGYDRLPSDILAVQDELAQKIVTTLVARITQAEINRNLKKPTESFSAYDSYLRANALIRNMGRDRRTIAAARAFFEQALAADPRYVQAIQGLANTEFLLWTIPCPDDPGGCEFRQQAVLDRALLLARQAVERDGTLAEAHATLAWILHWKDRDAEAADEFARAVEVNRNFVDARYGLVLSHWGRSPEAVDYMQRIMRLDPLHPPIYKYYLGKAYFFTGRYEEAAGLVQFAAERIPNHLPSRVLLATIAAYLGRIEQAQAAFADARQIDPKVSVTAYLRFMKLARNDYADRLMIGMRKAGFPE